MNNREITQFRDRLDYLFDKVASLGDDLELQAHWARYLCVLCSGFLEASVRAIYCDHVNACAAPHVARFAETRLRMFQTPKMQRILELAGAFKHEWRIELEDATSGALKDAVDSIVDNRNSIAHGRNVGISYAQIKDYYGRARKVVELLEHQCT